MAIDQSSISAVDQDGNAIAGIRIYNTVAGNSCLGPGAVRQLSIEFTGIDVDAGEFIDVTYDLTTNCACNDCDIRDKYFSNFALRGYEDRCLKTINDNGGINVSGRFDAFIQGLPEGPRSLFDGEDGCVSYFITNIQLDWLNAGYPDAYLEARFQLPCGLDFVPNTFEWTDRDGMVYPIDGASFSYVDNDTPGQDDELLVRFLATDQPPGFNYAGGGSFEFCVVADCSEKPDPTCGDAFFDEEISAQFDFTTDPDCPAACAIQKIWQPADLGVRIACPSGDPGCECDGITFTAFTVERTNFGLGDANNDQIPDGPADPAVVRRNRFIQGDSLRAHFEGTVQDADGDRDFDFGYIIFPVGQPDFTPLGATITVTRAATGITETCGAVPIRIDGPNNRVILDISPSSLNALGCGFGGGNSYLPGDFISVDFDYTEKFELSDQFRVIDYNPSFYVSEEAFDQGVRYQCNPLLARMTQVGLSTNFSFRNSNFGSCEQPFWEADYRRLIGAESIDEFTNEIRTLGLPERFVFNKPAEFDFRLENWDFILQQRISPANNIFDTRQNGTPGIPPEYFIVDGDRVTLLIGDYLRASSNMEIPPDEGYRIVIRPTIQGNCESVATSYDFSFQFFERVEAAIYCTSEIARSVAQRSFLYNGAAEIQVTSDRQFIRLCSGNDLAVVRVRNVQLPEATNAFLFPQATGQVIVNRIEDAATGQVILPNEFGIYPLGTINGQRERILNVFFTKNTCDNSRIDFIGGWDCNGLPETVNDALCSDPSGVALTSAKSNVDMLVTQPVRSSTEIIDLCDPVDFAAEIISSDLGFVRDIVLNFELPPNMVYDLGSFELSVPSPSKGGTYRTVIDPTPLGGNRYEIDIAALDEVLNTEGLVGSKDVTNNAIAIRFTASTGCGYFSGERVNFTIASNNACGDPLRPVRRRSGRIRTRDVVQDISITVEPLDIFFNACMPEARTVSTKATVSGGLTGVDSLRVLLPSGIEYVPGSYVPGLNAPPGTDPPVIRMENGLQALILPLVLIQDGGNMILFDVDVTASDIGQACREYDLVVDAYAASEDVCNGEVCQVADIRGRAEATATVRKPNYQFTDIDGSIELNAADGTATADFSTTLVNQGVAAPAGSVLEVAIFEDVNNNGSYDPTIDRFLFPISQALTQELGTGDRVTVRGSATFPASNICTVIAVIDPARTCACSVVPSATFRPEIIVNFEDEYDVCSNESVTVGPEPVAGYSYRWLSRGGSDVSALSATNVARPVFTAPANTTGAPLVVEYSVRISNAPCFTDEVVRITVAPLIQEVRDVQACLGSSFELPTVDTTGASNFTWAPAAGLTITENGRRATVDEVMGDETYTLTYDVGDGCPATVTVNLTGVDCGTANTQVGDFVWFDLNEDGVQDAEEPGIQGVTVNLINGATGAIISTTTTDADGMYLFDELPSGSYAIQVVAPPGFQFTLPTNSMDATEDSNVDPVTGLSAAEFVELDMANLDFDAGLIPDCSLELEVVIGDCEPVGGALQRRLTVTATWSGNPYAYDQFNDGNDTIDLSIMGEDYVVVVEELSGARLVVDMLISPDVETGLTATAAFRESGGCTATEVIPTFQPCIYDLALIKRASRVRPTPPPYVIGDLVCADIVVFNQGLQPVEGVQVIDSLPAGFVFNQVESDLGWTEIGALQLYVFPERLNPMETAMVTLCSNIQQATGDPDAYTNRGEINGFTDTLGNVFNDFDTDSSPDQDFGNDTGGEAGGPTDDEINDDGALDEDDADPFRISIYDLALRKMLAGPPPASAGDVVSFAITVINQGNEPASNIEVTDQYPPGLLFSSTNAGTWSAPTPGADGRMLTTATIAGPLAPGDSATVTLDLVFVGVQGQTDYLNVAEISDDDGDDIDSATDQDPANDAGGLAGSGSDDAIDGTGGGAPNSPDADGDEDDADPTLFTIELVSIGSTVFVDLDDDNNQGDSEPAIPMVTVELLFDENGDGAITGAELDPIQTDVTDANGDYFFENLIPGGYVVSIATEEFDGGQELEFTPNTSTNGANTGGDNQVDGDNNGIQMGGPGSPVQSGLIILSPGAEPVEDEEGFDTGAAQDDDFDDSGDMTIDFGFVCNLDIIDVRARTVCSVKLVDLRTAPRILPATVNGTYTTDGDGQFLDADEQPLTAPFRYDEVAFYRPGPEDARSGSLTLTLRTDAANLCPPVTETIPVEVLKVDCGEPLWDGNRP